MTLPMVAAILEVFFGRRTGRFNGNNVRKRPIYLAISPRSATIQKQKNRLDKVSLISQKI
jgi:hypothetical protein